MSRPKNVWVWRQIWWPRPFSPETAVEVLDRLATDRQLGQLVFEAVGEPGGVSYRVGIRPHHVRELTSLLSKLVPDIHIAEPASDARPQLMFAGRVKTTHPRLALNVDRVTAISRAVLAGLASANAEGEQVVLQVLLGERQTPEFVSNTSTDPQQSWFDLLVGGTARAGADARSSMKTRSGVHGFRTTIRIGATADAPARAKTLVSTVLNGLRVAQSAGVRLHFTEEAPHRLETVATPWQYPLVLSTRELAPLTGWPLTADPDAVLPGQPGAHPRVVAPPDFLAASQHPFAEATAPGRQIRFGIDARSSTRHSFLIGPTGAGKSSLMLPQIQAAIDEGRSVLVIDPKTDLVTAVLEHIPEHRKRDVVIIDPLSDRPVGINPLKGAGRNAGLVADTLLGVFRDLSGEAAWGIRVNDVFAAALTTLAHYDGATLPMLVPLLTDEHFRAKVLRQVTHDPLGLGSFWAEYEAMTPSMRAQVVAPALTRIRQFLLRPQMRAMLGQADPNFHLSELFTSRKIVLVPLGRGLLGLENARLLGSLIVGQLWPLIQARAAVPPERRHIVSVFIDEIGEFISGFGSSDLADALSQARGYGAAFTMAAQFRRQVPTSLIEAIDGNVGNKLVFGLNSAEDAAAYAKQAPGLEPADFQLLETRHLYANLTQGDRSTGWFSAKALPLAPASSDPIELRQLSAQAYGRPIGDVETEVLTAIGLQSNGERLTEVDTEDDEPVGRAGGRKGDRS
ncbi:type IV secretion system DNA-binding domain-containing protein [Microbacterium sp. NPDC076895]|uniref:type IV secretory system conjugative DNA transfer family protein n=1 Tax=Microbacterium sp. NPDC076895 TaxID=3154957 RepID=UPI003442F9FC